MLTQKPLQCWVLFELIFIYFFYIETKGPTLEEIVKIFDGPNAKVALIDLAKVEDEAHAQDLHDEKRTVEIEGSEERKV